MDEAMEYAANMLALPVDQWHLTRKAEGIYETVPVLSIPNELQEWARTPATRQDHSEKEESTNGPE